MNNLTTATTAHQFSPALVNDIADQCISRIGQWRSVLTKLGQGCWKDIEETSFLGKELRSGAIIAGMAELEYFLKELIVGICEEITAESLSINQLIPSLRPLAVFSVFESLSSSIDAEKIWPNRLAVPSLETNSDRVLMPPRQPRRPQPPLDGKTITPSHIARVSAVFSLPRISLPSAAEAASISKLSGLRNDLAHRNIPIVEVFSSKGVRSHDIEAHLNNLENLIVRLSLAWIEYLEERRYATHS